MEASQILKIRKNKIRKDYLKKRNEYPESMVAEDSRKISQKLMKTSEWQQASTICCYIDTNQEVSVKTIIEEAWRQNKKVMAPKVFRLGEMTFFQIEKWDDLQQGFKGISEPFEHLKAFQPETNDRVIGIIPLVAGDLKRNRIGYGGGYYDRWIDDMKRKLQNRIIFIGIAYDFQIVDILPTETFDIPLNMIITEKRIIK